MMYPKLKMHMNKYIITFVLDNLKTALDPSINKTVIFWPFPLLKKCWQLLWKEELFFHEVMPLVAFPCPWRCPIITYRANQNHWTMKMGWIWEGEFLWEYKGKWVGEIRMEYFIVRMCIRIDGWMHPILHVRKLKLSRNFYQFHLDLITFKYMDINTWIR